MIKLRIDVDYPYPSRLQSFIFTTLNRRTNRNYLTNSKIIAKMINESPQEVMAYWFFTPQTTPDQELLDLLHPDRHEVALHVANNPYPELEHLERATNRKVKYYTVHGTARLIARLMWRRKLWEDKAPIPSGFPLKSFYDFPTLGLDVLCYSNSVEQTVKIAEDSIAKGEVLHIHPEWLFQRGTINHRGPYYETLKNILKVDSDLEKLILTKKTFFVLAKDPEEYQKDIVPTKEFCDKLRERNVDVFTFVERSWTASTPKPSPFWVREEDNVGLLRVTSYQKWLKDIVKKTRHNMVRRAEKFGVSTEIVAEVHDKFIQDVWKIYNETPIRQNRAFPHYGISAEALKTMLQTKNCTIIAAFMQGELVGVAQMTHGNNVVILSQLLSLQEHWKTAINNALIAKAVQICEERGIRWLLYGRMETAHPSLDSFKRHNGFSKFPLTRFYIPLTGKGKIALKLGLHKELKDALPKSIKYPMIPLYSWVSRTKIRVRLKFRKA